jgi:hypothetical protein
MSNFDYTKLEFTIKEALEDINRSLYTLTKYRKIRSKIIEELELFKTSKHKISLFDEKSYSYKLVF